MYGYWQLGHMPVENYAKKHNRVAEAMYSVDPGIKLVGVGYLGDWDEKMLAESAGHMDLVSEHFYIDYLSQFWHNVSELLERLTIYWQTGGLLTHVNQIPYTIKTIADTHHNYRKTIESLAGKDLRIAVDEWNYWYGPHICGSSGTRSFLRDALGIAAGLHEYFRNSNIVFMANYSHTINRRGCIKTSATAAGLAVTGQVLKLYRNNFGVISVEISSIPEPLGVVAA